MSLAMVVIAVVVLSLFLHYLLFSLPTYRRYQLAAPLIINSLSRSLSFICMYIYIKEKGRLGSGRTSLYVCMYLCPPIFVHIYVVKKN